MGDQAEVAFLRVYLNTLTSQPIVYKDDYQQPPENSLKKIPVLQVLLLPRPLTLTFKSLKPPASFTLSVHPTDSILAVKQRLAEQPNGPPVAAQRLLLKGKALADAKLVKEYPLADKDTVNLVLKAVATPAPSDTTDVTMSDAPPPTLTLSTPTPAPAGTGDRPVVSAAQAAAHPRRHTRIPSVVLSPSPSAESPSASVTDITLTLDADGDGGGLPSEEISAYHVALAEPAFWERLLEFLNTSFPSPPDAARAWEDFLRASKGTLTASEVARIRDRVGVSGMAGT
ncbi:hypothetical protein B0H14DRAFT_3112940 [Mycena olivaceomarginata]|nr:hypothetical protein B0H14DRAFT_3112940 [Mycena olivaceomarginata]